jgi:small subunit ribosomal protein S17
MKKGMTMQGIIVRKSGDKTVAVKVVSHKTHPLYQKQIKSTKTYLAHDPHNSGQVGDTVTLRPTRPLSARKRWIIVPEDAA